MHDIKSNVISRKRLPNRTLLCCTVLSLWLCLTGMVTVVRSAEPPLKPDEIKFSHISVDKRARQINIRVRSAIREGILEYLLVMDEGKTYESVFKISGDLPSKLNFAMLLLGFKVLEFNSFMKLSQEKDGRSQLLKNHTDSLVDIKVRKDGKPFKLSNLLISREKVAEKPVWVYTGGFFQPDNRYAGDLALSHIGFWPDPTAVINMFSGLGNPYQGNFGFEMNRNDPRLQVDQDYEIVIRRYSK